jgi:hypothetical protein
MLLTEKEIQVPLAPGHRGLLSWVADAIGAALAPEEIPVRVALTRTDASGYCCELATLTGATGAYAPRSSIFEFRRRAYEETDAFNVVLLVPTGIGAEIGGHSGDAGPVARLLSTACDTLVTHPNVVNAADINELPEKDFYVEGSVISRLLMGTAGLSRARANRVLLVVDRHQDAFFNAEVANSVSAARAALGLHCAGVVQMEERVLMRSLYANSGRAAGRVEHLDRLCNVLTKHRREYDAVALTSLIQVPLHYHADYFRRDKPDMINPWGGVEAMLTHTISMIFDVPSAHSPMMDSREVMDTEVGVVDPRKAAEAVSTTFLHCILKGLHASPRIVPDAPLHGQSGVLTAAGISCLVVPDGCVGLPTLAALEQGIPVIAVRENRNCMRNRLEDLPFEPGKLFVVANYLEAVGVLAALKAGVSPDTVRRPLADTLLETFRDSTRLESLVPADALSEPADSRRTCADRS